MKSISISKSALVNREFSNIPTPCFVLDESLLIQNLEKLASFQEKAGVKIILATKGFSMHAVFPIIKKYLPGTTASSLHEARMGYEYFGGEVHAYSPAWLSHEWDEVVQYCNHISFNSLTQFDAFSNRIPSDKHISLGLRCNPEYSDVETDLYNPCIPGSRLGIFKEHLPATLPNQVEGLHFHNLCESNASGLVNTLNAVANNFENHLNQVKWVNFGGGHLITHLDYNTDQAINALTAFKSKFPHLTVYLEPGSAVAWQTGWLVAKVVDIVDSRGINVAILDTSISAHMPDCIEMPYTPLVLGASNDPKFGNFKYKFGGLTCLAGDFIGDYYYQNPLKIDDIVVFDDMIHYTMVKTTTFNGVNLPSIGIIQQNKTFKLVKKFNYTDFIERLS